MARPRSWPWTSSVPECIFTHFSAKVLLWLSVLGWGFQGHLLFSNPTNERGHWFIQQYRLDLGMHSRRNRRNSTTKDKQNPYYDGTDICLRECICLRHLCKNEIHIRTAFIGGDSNLISDSTLSPRNHVRWSCIKSQWRSWYMKNNMQLSPPFSPCDHLIWHITWRSMTLTEDDDFQAINIFFFFLSGHIKWWVVMIEPAPASSGYNQQHTATHATYCNTLPHTATYCNILPLI